jgi:hypothetical protein
LPLGGLREDERARADGAAEEVGPEGLDVVDVVAEGDRGDGDVSSSAE